MSSTLNTEDLIKSICSMCGLTRKEENEASRVFTKNELLLLHATVVTLIQENATLKEEKLNVEAITKATVHTIMNEGK